MRVLVTGASGFIGAAVVRRLAAEHAVTALIHTNNVPSIPGVATVRADLSDVAAIAEAVRETEAIVHLAGRSQVRESFERPRLYWDINVRGTKTLLEAALQEIRPGGRRVRWIQASTAAVYGVSSGQPIGEIAPTLPSSPYGESKLEAERAVERAVRAGLGAVVLRMFNVSGAVANVGDADPTRIIPRALAVAAGHEPELRINGDGSSIRDFVHVEDVARAYELALRTCQPDRCLIYNVGGVAASVNEVVETVRRVSGRSLAVSNDLSRSEVPVSVADTRRLRRLGWTPERSTLEEIVADAWEALKSGRCTPDGSPPA
ncbi:NAD-dependent epimerase/dehydratase family protein [Nonomuraea purpurea]|uniref:UDP-glucose 4-epimerase n=1 Tax=Nonomuraea purpurea TaxID=1849276 RepID=A0ABV8GS68_9ACTN